MKDIKEMKLGELKEYAKINNIDLGDAVFKKDIKDVIISAQKNTDIPRVLESKNIDLNARIVKIINKNVALCIANDVQISVTGDFSNLKNNQIIIVVKKGSSHILK